MFRLFGGMGVLKNLDFVSNRSLDYIHYFAMKRAWKIEGGTQGYTGRDGYGISALGNHVTCPLSGVLARTAAAGIDANALDFFLDSVKGAAMLSHGLKTS